jgi:cell filamentation protein
MASGFEQDPHSEQGNNCPRNVYGYTAYAELYPIESALGQKRGGELEDLGVTGSFDSAHLQSIHRYLFQDIFPWAGKFRLVYIAKPGSSSFAFPGHIASALTEVFDKLKREEYLKTLDRSKFAPRAAYYLGEINAIHPFREGNGRTQREFIRQLALNAGYTLSWAGFSQEQNVAASVLSHTRGDNSGLATII